MADNDYHFVDRWRVEGDVKEVADIIAGKSRVQATTYEWNLT
jgi:hypothetical protein